MTQRRQFDRASLPMPMRFRVLGGFGGMWLEGMVLDLSASGLRFTTPHPIDQGALTEFRIQLPDRMEPCMLTGQVLWVGESKSGPAYGAFFTRLTEKQQQMLDDLVQFLKRRQPPA